ncbi:hypothetical protein F5B20DRAFT_592916 [Whalleya microplaca]|nr:hypothetical protein F5B20DRAFT_592916 [Whalleya microplaca]
MSLPSSEITNPNPVTYSCLCKGPYALLPKLVQTFKTTRIPAYQESWGEAECDEKCPECQLDTELGAHEAISAIHCAPSTLVTYEVLESVLVGLMKRTRAAACDSWDHHELWKEMIRALFVWRKKVSLRQLASRVLREFGGDTAVALLRQIADEAYEVLITDIDLGHVCEPNHVFPGFTLRDIKEAIEDISGVTELEGFLKVVDGLSDPTNQP